MAGMHYFNIPGMPNMGFAVHPGGNGECKYEYKTPYAGPPNNGIPPTKPAPRPSAMQFDDWSQPIPGRWNSHGPPPPPTYNAMFASMSMTQRYMQAPPLSGNKVLGITPSFPGNIPGYIFPKHHVIIHLFHDNVINKYPAGADGSVYVPSYANNMWTAHYVPCSMQISELIEQIDCISRANFHQPYPNHAIGIQELLEEYDRSGRFRLGSRIMLEEDRARLTIGDIWPPGTGHAGHSKPPYLVRVPVCKSKL